MIQNTPKKLPIIDVITDSDIYLFIYKYCVKVEGEDLVAKWEGRKRRRWMGRFKGTIRKVCVRFGSAWSQIINIPKETCVYAPYYGWMNAEVTIISVQTNTHTHSRTHWTWRHLCDTWTLWIQTVLYVCMDLLHHHELHTYIHTYYVYINCLSASFKS